MKEFIIFITNSHSQSRQVTNALLFAKDALESGHRIKHVFFYAESVNVANSLLMANPEHFNIHNEWVTLADKNGLTLNVCVTASLKRGVLGTQEANYAELPANLKSPFQQVGMAEYFSILKQDEAIVSVQF